MADPEAVTFTSDGLKIVGDLYVPDDAVAGVSFPAIVLCHGFGGLRGFWFPHFARYFNRFGFVVLAFDHRNTGDSEGEPRLHLDPQGQVADIRSAVSFLETRPEVSADAIAAFKPETLVDRIAPRPSFFIGVENDTLVPTAETVSLFGKAGEPKRLHMFPAIGHHSVYYGEHLDALLEMASDWFVAHLGTAE